MNPDASSLGDVKLSYRFILVGLVSLNLFLLLFFVGIDDLAMGIYRANQIWTLAHLFILGFLIMTVMGVMYQLLPVALLVQIYSKKLAKIQFWIYLIGFIGLAYGLWTVNTEMMAIFGSITFIGALLFIINIFLSAKSITKWNMMSVIIIGGVFYFFMTVLFGLGLALNYQYGIWQMHDQILYSHITFGLIGWLTTLIIGFSYKLIPMFALSHGYTDKYAKWIFLGMQLGIISIVWGLFGTMNSLIWLGLILLTVTYLIFWYQVKVILKKKMKSKLDVGFKVASTYVVNGTMALILTFPLGFYLWGEQFILPFIYLFLTGWIGLSILGYLFKIVPFLWWTDKYSELVGKQNVPMLKDMVDEKKGKWAFILLAIGVIGNGLGIALNSQILMFITNSIYIIGGILYAYLVLRIFKM